MIVVSRPPETPLKILITALASFGMSGCQPSLDVNAIFNGTAGRWIDLTHELNEQTIFWPTAESFQLDTVAAGMTEGGYFYAANNFSTAEHGGTHLDAPVHFAQGMDSAADVPLSRLIGAAVVIDVSAQAHPDLLITTEMLIAWETTHGPIPDGAIVMLRTGWSSRWPNRQSYLGTAMFGPEAVPLLHFPGLDPAAAQWLVDNRTIGALGIDTPSIDYGQSTDFRTHQILYGANIPGFENVANLNALPLTGAFVVALPTKISQGSGGPLRIVAYVPNTTE